jgi:lysozyme
MVLTGPDVSHWQSRVDWAAVAAAGHDFAWCKATQGVARVDPQFERNVEGIRAVGLARGVYHFLDAEHDARAQARHLVDTARMADCMYALDVETEGTSNPTIAQAEAFAAEFRELMPGRPLVIYTSWGWWSGRDPSGRGARISPHLWHARYRPVGQGPGAMYGGWDAPTFWQHTSSGNCPGIDGGCDLNQFYGTVSDLRHLAGGRAPAPSPHPSEEDDDMPAPRKVTIASTTPQRFAYVLPDGLVVDTDHQGKHLVKGAASVDAFDAVYGGGSPNAVQVDIVQQAIGRERARMLHAG